MNEIKEFLRRTRDGGSCANCGGDYQGKPHSPRGARVLVETEPGVREPVNLCPDCYDEHAATWEDPVEEWRETA
jgi:hypothetical protein